MAMRSDPFDKLILVGRGEIRLGKSEGESVRAGEGDVVWVPKDLRHGITDVRASTLFLLCTSPLLGTITDDWFAVRADLVTDVRVWSNIPFRNELPPLWRRLLSEQERSDVGSPSLIRAEAVRLLVRLTRLEPDRETAVTDRIKRLLEEMSRSSFEHWSVDEAANRVSVSRRQFTKQFKTVTGSTFVDVLTRMRVDRVKDLLASEGYTVAGAAYACGFGDLAHFYRTFKRCEGRTPLDWVAQHKGKAR